MQAGEGVVRHAQTLQFEASGLLVEQAQHHPLAMRRRQCRDAHIDFVPGQTQGNPAVLRHTFFGDVEPRHDLDPRHQQRRQFAFGPEHLAQLTVDAHTHRQVVLEGFQMDVRSLCAHRFAEQRVDQADHRRIALLLEQVGGLRYLLGEAEQIQFIVQPLRDLLRGALAFAIGGGQTRGKRLWLKHLD